MNLIGTAIQQLHQSEQRLALDLLRLSERHRADHEIYHLGRDLARWCREHVSALARIGPLYGVTLDPDLETSGLLSAGQQEPTSPGETDAMVTPLLTDLRHLYREAILMSLDWEVLIWTAQAGRERELLEMAQRCRSQTLRQARWCSAKIKETAVQALLVS